MCICVHVCVCVCHIYAVPWSSEDSIKSLEAEVTRGCDHLMWVLRIELPSSGRAANALNGWNLSPAWRIFHFCFPFYFPFLLFPHPTYTILRFSSSFSFGLVSLVFSFSPLPSLLPPLSLVRSTFSMSSTGSWAFQGRCTDSGLPRLKSSTAAQGSRRTNHRIHARNGKQQGTATPQQLYSRYWRK